MEYWQVWDFSCIVQIGRRFRPCGAVPEIYESRHREPHTARRAKYPSDHSRPAGRPGHHALAGFRSDPALSLAAWLGHAGDAERNVEALFSGAGNHVSPVPAAAPPGSEGDVGKRLRFLTHQRRAHAGHGAVFTIPAFV